MFQASYLKAYVALSGERSQCVRRLTLKPMLHCQVKFSVCRASYLYAAVALSGERSQCADCLTVKPLLHCQEKGLSVSGVLPLSRCCIVRENVSVCRASYL